MMPAHISFSTIQTLDYATSNNFSLIPHSSSSTLHAPPQQQQAKGVSFALGPLAWSVNQSAWLLRKQAMQ